MLTREQVKANVIKTLIDNGASLTPQDGHTLVNDLGFDSLDITEIVMDLEDTFDIYISDDTINSCKTVEDIVNLTWEYMQDTHNPIT